MFNEIWPIAMAYGIAAAWVVFWHHVMKRLVPGEGKDLPMDFEERIRPSDFGVIGWWLFNMFYWTPMLTLPYFYTVDKARWNR